MSVDFSNPLYAPVTEVIPQFQLQAYLVSQGCNIETVTIIREKSTGTIPFTFAASLSLT